MKILKFTIFGLITFGMNLGLTYYLDNYIELGIYISYAISVISVIIINFILSLKVTFKSEYNHNIVIKYLVSTIIFSLLNYILVSLYNYFFGKEYIYIFISFIILVIFFIKFYIYDKFIFKNQK